MYFQPTFEINFHQRNLLALKADITVKYLPSRELPEITIPQRIWIHGEVPPAVTISPVVSQPDVIAIVSKNISCNATKNINFKGLDIRLPVKFFTFDESLT